MIEKRGGVKFAITALFVVLIICSAVIYALNETEPVIDNSSETIFLNFSVEEIISTNDTSTNETPVEVLPSVLPPVAVDVVPLLPEIAVVPEPVLSLEGRSVPYAIKDSDSVSVPVQVSVRRKGNPDLASVQAELYTVAVTPTAGPVQEIVFDDVVVGDSFSLGIDDVPETLAAPVGPWEEVYAIDPSSLDFSSAMVSVSATGNKLYKCAAWDFAAQECTGEWVFLRSVTPGEIYTFTLTADDPAFGEIIAVDAVHLDANYGYLSNIYEYVQAWDGNWSEPIYQDEMVRVTYEENLTDGKMIDVFVTSHNTLAYFAVYEAGTDHLVGRSGIVGGSELVYVPVYGLTAPSNVFDFKVVKVYPDPADDSPGIDANAVSFLQFDYIHDQRLNATSAEGLIGYEELNIAVPRYRLWNVSNAFTAELSANSVGVDGTADITWTVVRGSHEHNQTILGTEDKTNDVNIQIYNGNGTWSNLLEVSTNVPNSAFRAFDVAYEEISGDALIVFESNAGTDSNITYRIWNGSAYSDPVNITLGTPGPTNWVFLASRMGSDEIMLVTHNSTAGLYAVPWNGTGFEHEKNLSVSGTDSASTPHFGFAWEESSGGGLVVYASATNLVSQPYSGSTWGATSAIDMGAAQLLVASRLCSDPTSDHIGLIFQDDGADVNVRIWNGTDFLPSPPAEDAATEISGTNNANMDCAWIRNGSQALFGFIDANLLTMDYFNFTKSNTWGTTDLTVTPTTATFGSDDIAGLRFAAHPTTNEFMVVAQDILEDVTTIRWNGTAFVTIAASPLEASTEVLNGAEESAQFDWFRYDPVPLVFSLTPANGSNFSSGDAVNITVNVTDNVAVSRVFVNVTYPNASVSQFRLLDAENDTLFNVTFTDTIASGMYTFRIVANDTSSHRNINSSAVTVINVGGEVVVPLVNNTIPTAGSAFNVSETIEIGANVTDNALVSSVRANVTFPNGSNTSLGLSLVSGTNKYNVSFTIPLLIGRYNVTFIANDSSNNVNSSVMTFFIGNDSFAPNVTEFTPAAGSRFNVSDAIEISANVTDNFNVSSVRVNVTFPNSTIQQMVLSRFGTTNKYNVSFTVPLLIGRYNLTYLANDSNNNVNNTVTSFFNATEFVAPQVPDVIPTANSAFNVTDIIEIGANVTDNIAVSSVRANVTFPNGTNQSLTLSLVASTNKYNVSFTIPQVIGRYNVTFIANDTSNNFNTSVTTFFIGNDSNAPNVTGIIPTANTSFNVSENIEIGANISDNFNVSSARINVTLPNSSVQEYVLTRFGSTDKFNISFTIPQVLGRYNVTFIANDSNNNRNTSETTFFIGNDSLSPNVTNVAPTANTPFNISDNIEIGADVADNFNVSTVLANVTFPNSTLQQLTLARVGTTSRYNTSFKIPFSLGRYNITFLANDSNNNRNTSETTFFIGNDSIAPNLTNFVPVNGSQFNTSTSIEIAADVADNFNVSAVRANVSFPNGSAQLLVLSRFGTTNKYNASFAIPGVDGTYNITYIANDSNNNVNNTQRVSFVTSDANAPLVFDLIPTANTVFNASDLIEIGANVTDNVAVSSVRANVTFPNGTNQSLTLSLVASTNKYNVSFSIPQLLGRYNVSFLANDTANNRNATELTFFIVNDSIAPNVTGIAPVANTSFNVTDVIEIGANVSDNFNVSTVLANVTFPNSTFQQLTLSRVGMTSRYNVSFTIPLALGRYNVTFIANDSNNNRNTSETTFFIGNDSIAPLVFDLIPTANSTFNVSNVVEIGANVTDTFNVSAVRANLTLPNGTLQVLSLVRVGTTNKYNTSFTVPDVQGRYNITFLANDSNNNRNITEQTFFRVLDSVAPLVFDAIPTAGTNFNVTDLIEIGANVTDNVAVSSVRANVTFPNGTNQTFTLTLVASTNKYNVSFTIPQLLGRYNVSFLANDSNDNRNVTETTFFLVNDSIAPNVTGMVPAANTSFNYSDLIEIAANVSDNFNVSSVRANVTFPNSTIQQLILTRIGSTTKYNTSFSYPLLLGRYNVTFLANDSNNNRNTSESTFFILNDSIAPNVTNLVPTANTSFNASDNIEIGADVADNFNVSSVRANVTLPNSSIQQLVLVRFGSSVKFNVSFTIPPVLGRYNITFIANDTNNNRNTSETTFFVGNDSNAPNVSGLVPVANTSFNVSDVVEIAANVSDNGVVSSVRANVTWPNSTLQQVILSRVGTTDKYNISFTVPARLGRFNITFLANDTNNNRNTSETTFFTANDSYAPTVDNLVPAANTPFNVTDVIEVAANVTDNFNVSAVVANVTLANGSLQQLTLVRVGSTSRYNTSFTIPVVLGRYNITFIANDSNNNRNTTETSFFIANDSIAPLVFNLIPTNGSSFGLGQSIEIGANVTDVVNVSGVRANVSFPNGSAQMLTLSRILSTNKYNISFSISDGEGRYNVTFIANDTNNNVNNTELTFFTVNDTTAPLVFNLIPVTGGTVNISGAAEIGANVTDNVAVSGVLANVTFPNNTRQQLTLTRVGSTNKYNVSFNVPALLGAYNVTFIANDSSNNRNTTERTNFTAVDADSLNVTTLGCRPASANLSQSVVCNATVTDDIAVSFVTANVTFPNGSVQVQTVTNISANYVFTFANTLIIGRYNITWRANDSSNNVRLNTTDYFNVTDFTSPIVNLSQPGNNTNTSQTSLVFNFTALDNAVTDMNCSLRLDAGVNQTVTGVANNTITGFTVSGIGQGRHFWNVTCLDASSNSNISQTRRFTVDISAPLFISLTTSPSDADSLDPSVNITVSGNVTDNFTDPSTVILQRHLHNETIFVNQTMSFNTSSRLYEATFNATTNGTYVLRLYANDTVGNTDFSSTVNRSVEFESTWTRSPSVFSPVAAALNQNVSLGILVINNTGDTSLNFTLTSDSNRTIFNSSSSMNSSSNFSLAAHAVRNIRVNDTATETPRKTIALTISASPDASPSSFGTTGTILVATGQPILLATFTTPSTDTRNVTRGDTNVEFTATLQNIGEGNASNGTFFIEIPSDWSLTFGSLNTSFTELLTNETLDKTIEVTIPSSATLGVQNVTVNSTGVNASGADLRSNGLVFGDGVAVTVGAAAELGTGAAPSAGAGAGAEAGGGGGGGTSTSGGAVGFSPTGTGETIYTSQIISVVIGGSTKFNITLTNQYANSIFEDLDLEVQGFLSQYIRITPIIDPDKIVFVETETISSDIGETTVFNLTNLGDHNVTLRTVENNTAYVTVQSEPVDLTLQKGVPVHMDLDADGTMDSAIEFVEAAVYDYTLKVHTLGHPDPDRLYYGEEREYEVSLFVPPYLQKDIKNLTIKIAANIVAVNPELAGFTSKPFTEFRTITFTLYAVDPQDAYASLLRARADVNDMQAAGFPVSKAQDILLDAEDAYTAQDYSGTVAFSDTLHALRTTAFEAYELMQAVQQGIDKAHERQLAVPETESKLALAELAFEREDFETALQRAKDAQLLLVFETKGRVNLLWFLANYWWAVILGTIAIIVALYFLYKLLAVSIINQRLKNLRKEDEALYMLIEETQAAYFKKGIISADDYRRNMRQYETRLHKVHQLQAKLRNKKIGIRHIEQEIKNLYNEATDLQKSIRRVQDDYLKKKTITRGAFLEAYESYKSRLAQVEDERSALQERLEKEKVGKTSFLGLSKVSIWLRNLFRRKGGKGMDKAGEILSMETVTGNSFEQPDAKVNKAVRPDTKKASSLSQNLESKKKRREIYKMLKEEHDIDVREDGE